MMAALRLPASGAALRQSSGAALRHSSGAALRLSALGAALLLLSSCSGSDVPKSEPSPSTSSSASLPATSSSASPPVSVKPSVTRPSALQPLVLHIRNFAYVPAAPVVIVGQPIEIINDDAAAHTWSAAPRANWTYTSGNLEKGQQATFPGFTKPGQYKFLCYYHAEYPLMNGVATVKATR